MIFWGDLFRTDEFQLAGVIAHEIAHDTARQTNKQMKRSKIASLFSKGGTNRCDSAFRAIVAGTTKSCSISWHSFER